MSKHAQPMVIDTFDLFVVQNLLTRCPFDAIDVDAVILSVRANIDIVLHERGARANTRCFTMGQTQWTYMRAWL